MVDHERKSLTVMLLRFEDTNTTTHFYGYQDIVVIFSSLPLVVFQVLTTDLNRVTVGLCLPCIVVSNLVCLP